MADVALVPVDFDPFKAPGTGVAPAQKAELTDKIAQEQGSRGSAIASELKAKRGPVFPLEQAKPQVELKPVDYDPFAGPDTGVKASDFVKSGVAGVMSGAGMIPQGAGELLARGINMVGDRLGFDPQARAANPLQGWINDILDSRTPAAKKAEANSQISGNIMKGWDDWSFGKDPSVAGIALQGMNAIGQFAPNLGIALVTAGASIPAQLATGALVGGMQALGGGAEDERQAIAKMGHDELMAGSKLYAELIKKGVPQQQAKDAVGEAAALGGGLGNALPSAAEGAFENFLIGALTRGRIKIPSLGGGMAGRVATGVLGGGAMGGTEEAIEQAGQNLGSNIAIGGDRPLGADTLQNFVMGMIAEGAAGGGAGVLSKQPVEAGAPAPAPQPAPSEPIPQQTPAPLNTVPTTAAQAPAQATSGTEPLPAATPDAAPLSPIDQARADAQILKTGGELQGADDTRVRNATLVSVYGENAAVRHVIDGGMDSLGDAMLMAVPTVERVRGTIQSNEGSRDITNEILGAIDELAKIKESGGNLSQLMAEGIGHDISFEGQKLMEFLEANANNSKRIAAFLENYLQAVQDASGIPSEVRGRAFDIIEERRLAKKAEEEKLAGEQKAKKEAGAKEAETKKATEQMRAERALQAIANAKASGSGLNPDHKTTVELAAQAPRKIGESQKAYKKRLEAGNEKRSPEGSVAVPAAKAASVETRPAQLQGPAGNNERPAPEPAQADNQRDTRPVYPEGDRSGAETAGVAPAANALKDVPNSAFNGDLEDSLNQVFQSDQHDGRPVALASRGFTEAEIAALQRAGLADADGRMSVAQYAAWMAERGARLAPKPKTAAKTPVDQKAHEAATSPQNDKPEPTEAQKEVGNYEKGHARISGLDISIENPAGSHRRPEWPQLQAHYGYVKGVPARAPDKEHVDVFVKPGTAEDYNGPVFVIDQNHADGNFDEPKAMLGYRTQKEARVAYLKNFTAGWDRVRGITEMTLGQFKDKLNDAQGFLTPQQSNTITANDIPASLKITIPVFVEEAGETVMLEQNARKAFKSASQRVNRLKSLLDCLHAS